MTLNETVPDGICGHWVRIGPCILCEVTRLRAFAEAVLDDYLSDDPALEELAVDMKILVKEWRISPCSPDCRCQEEGNIPGNCYKLAWPREPE